MPHLRAPVAAGFVLLCTIALGLATTSDIGAQAAGRKVYASVTDKEKGTPLLDLKAAEFEVKDGGKTVEVSDVRLTEKPLRVALIVSDRGTGGFQGGALRFTEAILGHGEVSITAITVQPERFTDYSANIDVLRTGLLKLGRRGGTTPGAQLVEAIMDATKDLARDGYRPAMVVMRNGGEGSTSIRAETVRDALRKAGAVLYAVSTTGTQSVSSQSSAGSPMDSAAVAKAGAQSELAEGALTLGTIIGDGAKDSGGRHDQVISTTLIPTMQQIAAELVNQYEITYNLAAGAKPSDKISVATKRKGAVVHAPSRIAN